MTLAGKIVLCQLEEDNPQKSYFRIKPLYSIGPEGPEALESGAGIYPDEGGIRIVPDKLEAGQFRNRMRTIGGYCVLNLRKHTGENDKIRPNKNYSPERGEVNRNIVYSDVICPCPENEVMQVTAPVSASENLRLNVDTEVYTHRILTRVEDRLFGPYLWEKDETGITLTPVSGESVYDKEKIVKLRRGENEVELYISYTGNEPRKEAHRAEKAPATEHVPAAEEPKAEPAAPAEPVPAVEPAVPAEPVPAAEEPKAEPAAAEEPKAEPTAQAEPAAPVEPVPAAEAPKAEPAAPAEPVPAAEKPAPAPAERPAPQPVPERKPAPQMERKPLPPKPGERPPMERPARPPFDRPAESYAARRRSEEYLMGQLGLNPRRSKSVVEIVDEDFKHTRLEQLGAMVKSEEPSKPVLSPIELAQQALDDAWRYEDGRASLVRHLVGMDCMPKALKVAMGLATEGETRNTEMDALEAERLQLLREIDTLRAGKAEVRGEILKEALSTRAVQVEKLEKQRETLEAECAARKRAAANAKQAQKEAEELLDKKACEQLDGEFLKFAMFSKAAALLRNEPEADSGDTLGVPTTGKPTGAQMVSDLRRSFEDAGLELSHDDALNLLACLALGRIVIFSGPTGCGKTWMVRSLANALGLDNKGCARYAELNAAERDVRRTAAFRRILQSGNETLRLMLLDDVNAAPVPDQSRGLMAFADKGEEGITVCMTVQDDQIGFPVDVRLLDRAFFIRLKRPEKLTWRRAAQVAKADCAADWETVKAIFHPENEVPAEIASRFEILCDRLASLGTGFTPRAMADMYAYCAAFAPLMTGEPISALDRAVAQRGLPYILATASPKVVRELPKLLCDMPICLALLNKPLPLYPM